jgi:hypothetical protein
MPAPYPAMFRDSPRAFTAPSPSVHAK